MRELADLLARLRALEGAPSPADAALATVVRVEGSSYRREGARMLIERDGRLTGVLTGGCLERDLIALASEVLAAGRPRTVEFDLSADEEAFWGTGTGCAGKVTMLVEPLDGTRRAEWIALLGEVLEARREARFATLVRVPRDDEASAGAVGRRLRAGDDRSGADPEGLLAAVRTALAALDAGRARAERIDLGRSGAVDVLLESLLPPVHLLVVGAERDTPALLALARELGWAATVVDPRPTPAAEARVAGRARFVAAPPRGLASAVELSPRTAVVLATHRYLDDLAFLDELAGAPVGYLALLGPARRRERLLDDLARRAPDAAEAARARLRGPAGLDLGGRSPEEVALSIVAEIQRTFAGGSGRPLTERAAASAAQSVSTTLTSRRSGAP